MARFIALFLLPFFFPFSLYGVYSAGILFHSEHNVASRLASSIAGEYHQGTFQAAVLIFGERQEKD